MWQFQDCVIVCPSVESTQFTSTLFSFYKNYFYKNHWGSDLVQIFTENGEELIDWKENFAKRNSTSKEAF